MQMRRTCVWCTARCMPLASMLHVLTYSVCMHATFVELIWLIVAHPLVALCVPAYRWPVGKYNTFLKSRNLETGKALAYELK